jgi:hypothetical protein
MIKVEMTRAPALRRGLSGKGYDLKGLSLASTNKGFLQPPSVFRFR